jgi:uncharacterized protein DUF5317
MTALVFPIGFGLVLALALGGSMRGWALVRLRWPLLLVLPFPVLFVIYNPPLDTQPWLVAWGPRIWEIAQVTLAVALARNMLAATGTQRIPWAIALAGLGLNAMVVMANSGYMPVSPDAPMWVLEKATASEHIDRLHNTIVMTSSTQLNLLGDILVQPAWMPPRPNVVSIGDLILSAGVAWWVFAMTLVRDRESTPAPRSAPV